VRPLISQRNKRPSSCTCCRKQRTGVAERRT
jgi:hypothetical protein